MDSLNIEIFYDGLNLSKYSFNKIIKGFTTNCTLFSGSSSKNYSSFFLENKHNLRPNKNKNNNNMTINIYSLFKIILSTIFL